MFQSCKRRLPTLLCMSKTCDKLVRDMIHQRSEFSFMAVIWHLLSNRILQQVVTSKDKKKTDPSKLKQEQRVCSPNLLCNENLDLK